MARDISNRPDKRSPDSIRPRATRREQDYDEFRETLAAPIPNRTYRSEIDMTVDRSSVAEQIIRFLATILTALAALRFITSLFSANRSHGFVNIIYGLTDWMVRPFQSILGQPAAGTGGFVDLSALATLIVISALAWLLIRLIRPRLDY